VLKYLLTIYFPQTVSPSSPAIQWNGHFQAQPLLAAFILLTSSRQFQAHQCFLPALLNGPFDQAGHRPVPVLRIQNYFAIPPAEQIAALAAFRLPLDTGGFQ
jgi:hypothetical protein